MKSKKSSLRIVLIIPPMPFLLDQKRNCPLGILYIGSALEANKYDVDIVDLRGVKNSDWGRVIPPAGIYGITAVTPEYNTALKIAQFIKGRHQACVILGGVHATVMPEKIDTIFDKVVIGEGEEVILEAVEDYKKKITKRFYQGSRIDDLDKIPFPARHLLPFDSVFSDKLVQPGLPATTIIASRGCPFGCSFCASKKVWKRHAKLRSPDNIVNEIKQIIKTYKVSSFRFIDDIVSLNKDICFELCKKLEPLQIRWRANTRVDIADQEMLKMMKQSGCLEVDFGIESISQTVLDMNNKGTKLSAIFKTVEYAKKAGLRTRLFFIVGLPGEELGFADRVIDFCKKTDPDGIDVSTFVPYPGSDVYENPAKYGIKLEAASFDEYIFTLGLDDAELNKGFFWKHPNLSCEELREERKKVLIFAQAHNLVLNK